MLKANILGFLALVSQMVKGQIVPEKTYKLTGVSSSDGHSMDSKVTRTVDVRTIVECSAYAQHHGSHGFRMKNDNKTCQLMNLQWTQLNAGGSDQVYFDESIPPYPVQWTQWSSSWSGCNQPCDTGNQYKRRSCPTAQYRGVRDCPGADIKYQNCNPQVCPRIRAIEWKTNTESFADMADKDDDKGIRVYLQSQHGEGCWTRALNNEDWSDDWKKGSTSKFDSGDTYQLSGCWNFRVPDHNMYFVRLRHNGRDSWKGEWVDLHFNFGPKLRCKTKDGKRWYIFKDDEVDIYCS